MADNATIPDIDDNPVVVATHDISGVEFQKIVGADKTTGEATNLATKESVDAVAAKLITAPSTEAKQDAILTALSAVQVALALLATQSTLASVDGKLPALSGGKVPVTDPTALPLPSGASTAALQTTGNSSLSSMDGKLTNQATAALQTTGNSSLSSIDSKLTSQATATKQDTGNSSLSSIDGKLTTGNSSLSSIDGKLTSQATATKQDTGNSSLASIDGKLTNQATAGKQDLAQVSLTALVDSMAELLANRLPALLAANGSLKTYDAILDSTVDQDSGKLNTGNIREKYKFGFSELADIDFHRSTGTGDLFFVDGNVAGSSWNDICKSLFNTNTETVLLSKKAFKVPYQLEFGMGLSQRINGQEFSIEMVAVNADSQGNVASINDVISTNSELADNPIVSLIVSGNVATVTCTNNVNNNYRAGDTVVIQGCGDSRINVGPVVIAAIGSSSDYIFTIPLTIADGSYTITGGSVKFVCPAKGADYMFGTRWQGTSSNNVDATSRNGIVDGTGNNNRVRVVAWNNSNGQTDASLPNENGINYSNVQFTRSFRSKGLWRNEHTARHLSWLVKDSDSATGQRGTLPRESEIPHQDNWYAIRYRARNFGNISRPIGTELAVKQAVKTASATVVATITGHGLTGAQNRGRYIGARDQTNFASMTTDAQVTVIDANTISFTLGSSTTQTTFGGVFILVNASAVPTVQTISAQTYNKSYDGKRLVLVGSGTWTEIVGDIVWVGGIVESAGATPKTALNGRYRVERMITTTIELLPFDGQEAAVTAAPSTATNCGGAIIRCTSFRLHYVGIIDYFRMFVEPANPSGINSRSMPAHVTNTPSVSATQSSRATVGSGWYVEPDNLLVADIASAALTSTSTSSTITPTPVGAAASFCIPITAVSGTNPTMDVGIEESDDTGTNWKRIYDFPRVVATGFLRSPILMLNGNRIRYVRTVGGTTPSFTNAVNRITHQMVSVPMIRQRFDRTIVLTTLNSATPVLYTEGATNVRLEIKVGAITTTAPQLQLQGSNDNGVTWQNIGTTLTAVASSLVGALNTGVLFERVRAIAAVAGVGVTSDYVLIKAYNNG